MNSEDGIKKVELKNVEDTTRDEIDLVDEVKKMNKKRRNWKTAFWIFMLIFALTFGGGMIRYNIIEHHFLEKVVELKSTISKTTSEKYDLIQSSELQSQYFETEIQKLEHKLEGLKTQDDLMVRDIQIFIKTKYRKVSTIVAKTIALNIVSKCKEYKASVPLVIGIMRVESAFIPTAVSKKGAIGLMQVMPEWASKLGLKNKYVLFDIPVNIESGIKVLNHHIKEDGKGNISKGLYFYVGKDSTYAANVYKAAGEFIIFTSTIDDEKTSMAAEEKEDSNGGNGKEKPVEPVKGAKESQ